MKVSSKIVLIIFFIVIIIILAYSIIPTNQNEEIENKKDLNINYEKLGDVVFNVKTRPVTKGDLVKHISSNGIVKAFTDLEVVANISGYINEVNIHEGLRVNKSDLLLKFDDREYRIALNEAEVNLTNAKIEYGFFTKGVPENNKNVEADSIEQEIKKIDKLFNEKRLTEEEYLVRKQNLDLALLFTGAKRDEVMLNKSGMTNAINAINKAQLNLSYTEIKAPFSGVIADFNLVPGARVNSGEILFRLLDISKLKVEVGVLENEIRYVKTGSRCEIKLSAISNELYKGKVIYINPTVDAETKTCRITIEIANPDKNIKPGMFANVDIESEILKDKILIPKEALLVRDKRNLVFVVESDTDNTEYSLAKWHYVRIGEQNDNFIEVQEGISAGDNVIIEGHYNLAHDAKVRVEM